jgi:tetratricopeptide (TPR) repeat protein
MILRSLILLLCLASVAICADRLRTTTGTLTGKITKTSPQAITVDTAAGEKEAAINTVTAVLFDDEPSELSQARVNAANGGYQTALAKLAGIKLAEVKNPLVRQEIEYLRAWSQAKLALGGEGDLLAAGQQLNSFVAKNRQSHHTLDAAVVLGDLLVAAERYPAAEKLYAQLAETPWPDYQMRAALLIGKAQQAQGKHAEAIGQFDQGLELADTSDAAKAAALACQLGKAVSLSAIGKADEGLKLVQAVIKDADPEDRPLNAAAYNALGDCYRVAKQTKPALFAYLHTDLLYSSEPAAHAEALYHLTQLWDAIGRPDQSRAAKQTLAEKYAASPWAKRE